VPRPATELAIGGRAEPGLALEGDHLLDRAVLDPTQLRVVDPARRMLLTGLEQTGRTEQAADVVGSEWRGVAEHGFLLERNGVVASTMARRS